MTSFRLLRSPARLVLLAAALGALAACSRTPEGTASGAEKKSPASASLFGHLSSMASAGKIPFYMGTAVEDHAQQGIYLAALDARTGAFTAPRKVAETPGPATFLALSPDGNTLYATIESDPGQVGTYRIAADGSLAELNRLPTGGAAPCQLSLDASGRHLFVANYTGSAAVFALGADGALAERTAFLPLTGSGPDAARQEGPHAHGFYASPDGRFALLCDLGTDEVRLYRFDTEHGTVTPQQPPSGKVPPGAGPRHLAFGPSGRFAYVTNEMGRSLTTFAWDGGLGTLTPLRTVPTVPAGTPADGVTASELAFDSAGRFLYVSNRGHDSVAVFAVAADGTLGPPLDIPAGVNFPRHFAIDPSGQWLVTEGQKDGRMASFRIDRQTGGLTLVGTAPTIPVPTCVVFRPGR